MDEFSIWEVAESVAVDVVVAVAYVLLRSRPLTYKIDPFVLEIQLQTDRCTDDLGSTDPRLMET